MARTRGASHQFHQDDGVILGKDGQPISPRPFAPVPIGVAPLDRQGAYISPAAATLSMPKNLAGSRVLHGPGAEPVPAQATIAGYRADAKTWSRNMEAWELARLLDLAFRHNAEDLGDGFVVNLTVDEFNALDGNMRRHFMPVRE